jgi:hypothetical protein
MQMQLTKNNVKCFFQKSERELSSTVSASASSSASTSGSGSKNYWLKRDIVVKIVTKSLGDK